MTKKKFAELELSLLHLQHNVEIPETHLIIHPVIQRAVDQVRALNYLLCLATYWAVGDCNGLTTEYFAHPRKDLER